jgi:hypothetical protein
MERIALLALLFARPHTSSWTKIANDYHSPVVTRCGLGKDMAHSKHETRVHRPSFPALTVNALNAGRTPRFPLDVASLPYRNVTDMPEKTTSGYQEGLAVGISPIQTK